LQSLHLPHLAEAHFNFSLQADDPISEEFGAGAGSNFRGFEDAQKNFQQTAGVIEGRPGIIETTDLDPLKETSNQGEHMRVDKR
jgi:hypothetical protein